MVDIYLLRTIAYAAVGIWLFKRGVNIGRLAGIGAGFHYIVVSWRTGMLIFWNDWPYWSAVHTITIFFALACVLIDMYVEFNAKKKRAA